MNANRRRTSAGADSDDPEGFSLYRTEAFEDSHQGVEILLPIALQWRLVEERRALARAREEERNAAGLARLLAARDATRAPSTNVAHSPAGSEDRLSFIKRFERGVARRDRKRHHPVLKAEEVLRVLAKTATLRNKDEHKRELELMEKVKSLGALREVASPTRYPDRWARSVDGLRASHPHFLHVTDFVVEHVALAMSSRGPLSIPPLHLWGPPGIGKSHYANDLAIALGAPLRRQSMENAQTTSLLLGTERHWSTACPGAVFDEIVLGKFANPVFLIDELDKAPANSTYDPLRPLHSLLEPFTAATIRDAALDITFDASLAIYIAASNDPTKIPESLRSRFSEFHIPLPHGEDALQIAQVVAARTIEKLSVPDFLPPEPRLAYRLAHLTPRGIRKAIQRAVARAIVNDRKYLKPSDLPADVLDEDGPRVVLH